MPGQPMPGQEPMGDPNAFPVGPEGMPGGLEAGPPLPEEVVEYIQQLEEALAQAQGDGGFEDNEDEYGDSENPFGKNYTEEHDVSDVDFLQELAKNLEDEDTREAVNKALEEVTKANERAEAAEEIAKAERDFRLNQEYISKARAYTNLPLDAAEFGPVLKRLHEAMEDEDVAVVEKALAAANEAMGQSGIYSEIGKRGIGGEFSVVSKVDDQARSLVEKSENLSLEQARLQVLESNPRLYDEYLNETTGRA
jgi:hypothetical protein